MRKRIIAAVRLVWVTLGEPFRRAQAVREQAYALGFAAGQKAGRADAMRAFGEELPGMLRAAIETGKQIAEMDALARIAPKGSTEKARVH